MENKDAGKPSFFKHYGFSIGQKLAGGSKPEGQLDLVTSEEQADLFYGRGSMLSHMVKAWRQDNKNTSLTCIALDDNGAGNEAAGQIDFTGVATEDGTVSIKVAGRRYQAGVLDTQTDSNVVSALVTAIQADLDRKMDAAINGGDATILDLTFRHKGLVGNEMDIRINPESDDILPAGMAAVPTQPSGGTANPDIADAIVAMGDIEFHIIAQPYTDSANLDALETELADRFGPIRQIQGQSITGKNDSHSNLISFGDGRNSPHVTTVAAIGPTPTFEQAANVAGVVAFNGQIDPARPFQTLACNAIDAPDDSEIFDFNENDLLLKDGIATLAVNAGLVQVQRLITMSQVNAASAPDTSQLNLNTMLTLMFLRFDFRSQIQLRYPRHKLANDGNNFGPGQPILTPNLGKAEAVRIFKGWEELGLAENLSQFKRDLIVQRNASDPDRLDWLLPPDLVNQLRVNGVQIGYLL